MRMTKTPTPVNSQHFAVQRQERADKGHALFFQLADIALQKLGVAGNHGAVEGAGRTIRVLLLPGQAGEKDGLHPPLDQVQHVAVGELGRITDRL